ncbi:D-alanyl-D-alanine carboxypeptidase, partial [Vibrio rotiferianus]
KVLYKVDGDVVKETELVALEPVDEGGIFKRLVDWFKRLVASWF